jgi:hypothetical protein
MSDSTKLKFQRGMDEQASRELALAMLEVPMSQIETLPSFVQLPAGKFIMNTCVSAEAKPDEEFGVRIDIVFEVGQAIELAKYPNVNVSDIPSDELPPEGALYSVGFLGALGVARFCTIFGEAAAASGQDLTVPQMVEALAFNSLGTIAIINGRRADKEKKDIDPNTGAEVPKTYNNLIGVMVV